MFVGRTRNRRRHEAVIDIALLRRKAVKSHIAKERRRSKMTEWYMSVNTLILEQNIENLRQYLSDLYQSMEIGEVTLSYLQGIWSGEAQILFFQSMDRTWEQVESQKKIMENLIGKLEQISSAYGSCERKVMDVIAVL